VIKPDIGDSQLVIDYRQESSNRHSRTGFLMQRLSTLHCKYGWHQLHMAWGKGQVPLPHLYKLQVTGAQSVELGMWRSSNAV